MTKPGEGFGFSFSGGVNGDLANPFDETDEGIFVSEVVPGGAAARDGRLTVGTRILQVRHAPHTVLLYCGLVSKLHMYMYNDYMYSTCI